MEAGEAAEAGEAGEAGEQISREASREMSISRETSREIDISREISREIAAPEVVMASGLVVEELADALRSSVLPPDPTPTPTLTLSSTLTLPLSRCCRPTSSAPWPNTSSSSAWVKTRA